MKYELYPTVKERHPFRWVISVLFVVTAIGWLYLFDYANVIDVPLIDNYYDRSAVTK